MSGKDTERAYRNLLPLIQAASNSADPDALVKHLKKLSKPVFLNPSKSTKGLIKKYFIDKAACQLSALPSIPEELALPTSVSTTPPSTPSSMTASSSGSSTPSARTSTVVLDLSVLPLPGGAIVSVGADPADAYRAYQ